MELLGSISELFIISCASGPVTTQIDLKKNPVAGIPTQFQSPTEAIDGFLDLDDSKTLKDALVIVSRLRVCLLAWTRALIYIELRF